VSDIVKEPDFLEQLAILVAGPDEAQGSLSPEREADLVGDVVVRLGDIGARDLVDICPDLNKDAEAEAFKRRFDNARRASRPVGRPIFRNIAIVAAFLEVTPGGGHG